MNEVILAEEPSDAVVKAWTVAPRLVIGDLDEFTPDEAHQIGFQEGCHYGMKAVYDEVVSLFGDWLTADDLYALRSRFIP